MTRSRGLFAGALAVLLLTALAATAAARTPSAVTAATYRCHGTTASGRVWAIRQRSTNCRFARYAVKLAVEKRKSPTNWRCYIDQSGEFGPERRDYRVRCYRGSKAVLGLSR